MIQNFANEYRERIMADLFANTINQQQTQHQIQAHQRRQYANHQLHQYAPDPDIYMENSVAANQQQRQQGMPNRGLSKASTTNSLLSSIQNMRNAGQAQRNPIMNEILASSSNLASVVEANEAMRRSHRQPPQNQLRQSDYIPNLPVTQLAQYHRNQVLAQTFNNQQQPQTINRLPITRVSSALSQQQRSSTPNKQWEKYVMIVDILKKTLKIWLTHNLFHFYLDFDFFVYLFFSGRPDAFKSAIKSLFIFRF